MSGQTAFLELFGSITIADVVQMVLAISFLVYVGKKIANYLVARHEAEKTKDEQLKKVLERLDAIEKDTKKRERNRIRENLLRNYRYFTSKTKNPMQSWTRMEADAFWEEYRDYIDAGGNGHVKEEVQPKMRELEVVEMYETELVTELMHSRG